MKNNYGTRLINKASIVPILLRKDTIRCLDEDERMGIISKFPVNMHPVINYRMHIVSKEGGKTQKTIDIRFQNLQPTHELNYTTPSFQKVEDIPPHTWKSVLDAWNDYQSITIAEESKHLTTFITE